MSAHPTTSRLLQACAAHLMAVVCLPGLAGGAPFEGTIAPAFQLSCVKCHGAKGKVKGKVNLSELQGAADLTARPELLEDLIVALRDREMPPEDEPELAPALRAQLVTELEMLLHSAVGAGTTFAQAPLRRMNRFQYNNAVQDLFELKVEVFTLPERMLREHGRYFDPASHKMPAQLKAGSRPLGKSQLIEPRLAGVAPFPQDLRAENGFDNRGDHLSLSPLLLESFLKLSQSIVDSRDFNPKTCGIWPELFAPPPAGEGTGLPELRERLRPFLSRAFRRPVDAPTLERYAGYVAAQLAVGVAFTDAMKSAASAAIASPRFLYLYDLASDGDGEQAVPLDDFELASRLSFFLWGSLPDQALFDLAAQGQLRDPEVLAGQLGRMLDDRRLKRFCDSFPAQWLQLERLISSVPDPQQFPEFYFSKYRASMHMMLEPLLLFEAILIEDRSILELVDADFSYRSALLDSWYLTGARRAKANAGQPTEIPFRRVALADRRQGGVITSAAVMTMTSGTERTKPITRGAWIASVIFNDPPEPPPANVPPLEENAPEAKDLTLRQRLDAHRKRADCAGCHEKIDPLGFALENFGPTGGWRDRYENGLAIDPGGVLFREHEFTDIVGFKDAILAEKQRFATAFAGHLLSFALGRELGAADSIALQQVVSKTAPGGYSLRSIIREIVLSDPFLHKTNPRSPHEAVTEPSDQ